MSFSMVQVALIFAGMSINQDVQAQSPIDGLLANNPGLDTTQTSMARVIEVACPNQTNEIQFQTRCNALVRALQRSGESNTPLDQAGAVNGMQQASPEQIPSQGVSATRSSFQMIGGRLAALRAGSRGFQIAGLGNFPLPINLASVSDPIGGAAGDDADTWSRLGGFVNGSFNTGEVGAEANQFGYNFNNGSINFGVDYRLLDELVIGTAFTYMRSESGFANNGGSLDSNHYTGAIYGTYNPTDNLYFDAIASFGGLNYDTSRHIQYSVPGDIVNTDAKGTSGGNQYSVSLGTGYNYATGQWLLNPYAKVNYIKLDVDGFSETGGNGWGMQFADQSVESVTTTLGSQIAYTASMSWGVLMPNVHGEWHHQYKDGSRNIAVRLLGDTTSGLSFDTVTTAPDRNYFTVGTGVSGTFAHGFSAFFNYDALVGYRNVDSHMFTLGTRIEF